MDLHSVMILDDENWIVRGLIDMIDWRAEGFSLLGGYTDPVEALGQIRRQEPDLLLLDIKMPKITGDVIMEMIREEGIPCEFMILSGYSDFAIAKRAIQHGAFDYILKPFEKDELLAALRRVRKILTERKLGRKGHPLDPKNSNEILQALSPNGFRDSAPSFYRVILSDKDQFLTQPSLPGTTFWGPATSYGGRLIWMLMSPEDDADHLSAYLEEWARDNQLSLGVSRCGRSTYEYHSMYRQANCALCTAYLLEEEGCFFYTPPDLQEVKQWQDRLLEVYKSKDVEVIQGEISRLIDRWRLQGNPASVSLLIAQLTYGIASASDGQVLQDQNQMEIILFDDISSQFSNTSELFNHLLMLLNVNQSKEADMIMSAPQTIRNIRKYLLEHYSEELNLSRLSSQFYLTPSYLSELFRRYTGETISSYLLKIRMEKSADLLRHSSKSLTAISEESGYNEYNYFCRLFKRYYGVSPTKYRRRENGETIGNNR